jgi:hypothetical protein
MRDILFPLGLLIFIGLFTYALIRAGRKQRKAKSQAFLEFTIRHGLRYQEEDDGKAQRFAADFDGVSRFRSSSLGKKIPKDVVSGTIEGNPIVLFRHSIRYSEGWAREWFVAGLTRPDPIAGRCAVQFCKKNADKNTMRLPDAVVKERNIGSFTMVVRAPTPADAGRVEDDRILAQLAELADKLSFRPEIQIRGNRIIAYPAGRNASIDDVDTLEELVDFTRRAAAL